MPGTTFPTLMTFEASGEDIILTEIFLQAKILILAGQFLNLDVL